MYQTNGRETGEKTCTICFGSRPIFNMECGLFFYLIVIVLIFTIAQFYHYSFWSEYDISPNIQRAMTLLRQKFYENVRNSGSNKVRSV